MEHNLIIAGVGGQGILTIARGLSLAALNRGLHVKQAEVHGMSQRGGAVEAHVRIADHEIYSDTVGAGRADLIVAIEPLESLRYVQYLAPGGAVVVSTNAFVNIDDYPPIESVLDRVAQFPRHALLDMEKLARAAGSPRSANMVALGAASLYLQMDPAALEEAVAELFQAKGEKLVACNRRAFRFGRNAAAAYVDGLLRGAAPKAVRQWIDTLAPEHLAGDNPPEADAVAIEETPDRLSGAEAHAFESTLVRAYNEGRRRLYEHEVYSLVEIVGAITPPRHLFLPRGRVITRDALSRFPGERLVLKLVSPDVVHKSDVEAVAFVPNQIEAVRREIDRMVERHAAAGEVAGVLLVEYVEPEFRGFGSELFVGIRATREFGPVIAAGLGGLETEYLATRMAPGAAVAKALANHTTPERFLETFKLTAAYDVIAGQVRGHKRLVSDGELLRCFRAFINIARRFCVDRGEEGPDIGELEVNPFAFRGQRLVPLDGRGSMQTATRIPPKRPLEKAAGLLEPKSMAVVGVSSKSMNFGRIILGNVVRCGYPIDRLWVVKEGEEAIDGVRCVPSITALPQPVDLLVVATPASGLPAVVEEANASGKVRAGILISGGVGEADGAEELTQAVRDALRRGRERPDGGAVFLGPNCMGLQSRPGRYDTFFIPQRKLDTRWTAPARRVALISQSGAFIVSRLSNLSTLDPAIAVSIGNQMDLTLSDVLWTVSEREDVDAIGVYVEGFADGDGAEFVRAVKAVVARGKTVVFYKAGRTAVGRNAAAGHTASVAGDYDVCLAAAENAGALVASGFKEFEQLLEVATYLHGKKVRGDRVYAITNAGMEAVGMADAIRGPGYEVRMEPPSAELRERFAAILARHKLDRLVNLRNPLDVTPAAGDAVFAEAIELLLASEEVDALIVGGVPLTPEMKTAPDEIDEAGSLAKVVPEAFRASDKPVVFVVDAGSLYDPLANAVHEQGVPVFRSADQAVAALGRYLRSRAGASRSG